jgi:hypothetical protein
MRMFHLVLALVLPVTATAQDDEQWPPLSYLRSDYHRVSVVAHVRVREAETVNRIGGYEDWHLAGEVVESFKGKFRKGNTIEFYEGAEAGFRKELFLGDKIVFLQRNFVAKEKKWVLAALENSTLPVYSRSRSEVADYQALDAAAKTCSRQLEIRNSNCTVPCMLLSASDFYINLASLLKNLSERRPVRLRSRHFGQTVSVTHDFKPGAKQTK